MSRRADLHMRIEGEKHRLDVHNADLSGSRLRRRQPVRAADFHDINHVRAALSTTSNMSGWRVRNVNLAGLQDRKGEPRRRLDRRRPDGGHDD